MTTNPYRLAGHRNAHQKGRSAELDRALKILQKPNAEHLSIIGPPRMGKTAMLRDLAKTLTGAQQAYAASVYIDLSHPTPASEEAFRQALATGIQAALKKDYPDIAALIDDGGAALMDDLMLVIDELQEKDKRILVLLDGMDQLFRVTDISRNLWDNLFTLAQKPALRLVTGSRARLRELCRSEESRTSDFWELFHNPMPLVAFNVEQITEAAGDLGAKSIVLDVSAAKELRQWTGGHAALVAGFFGVVFECFNSRTLLAADINSLAGTVENELRDLLEALWDELAVEEKMILVKLAERDLDVEQVPAENKAHLLDRGMITVSGNTAKGACRLILSLAKTKGTTVDQIALLFSDEISYLANIKPMLELRLRQVKGGDADLRRYIEYALRDLHPDPTCAITWARNISTRALQLIWLKESPPDGKHVPSTWVSAWKMNTGSGSVQNLLGRLGASQRIPGENGVQIQLLRFATGTDQVPRETKILTKPVFELLDFVHAVGDYGQHKTDPATQGIATAFCHAAVELFASLS